MGELLTDQYPIWVEPSGSITRQEATRLVQQNRRAYVLVNDRLEGNAPLTAQALTDLMRMDEGR